MILPFIGWAITGAVFFFKPGYAGAYEYLQPRTYPMGEGLSLRADSSWLEVRYLRTILGDHLLVRTEDGWSHLDPASLRARSLPGDDQVRALLADAFSKNPERYGRVSSIEGSKALTSTGVQVSLNWAQMSLSQKGPDTDRIDLLYKIHYLQWTGSPIADRVIGMTGIALVLTLTGLGVRLFFGSR
ncbi:MAG TPA: hypothetical protein VNH22_15530 [Blastocatellia bacterium]|jgi:hypothetical protein|nr:hypothetical protein [Blastocatellia bacterium]